MTLIFQSFHGSASFPTKQNINNGNINNKVITNIIIKVSSTTIVTAVFACFVYCIL